MWNSCKMKNYKNKGLKTSSSEVVAECVNLIYEKTGLLMYDEQVNAALSMYKDRIVNLVTGGGKSLVVLLTAMLYARDGHKTYVLTTNDYLVKRDYEFSKEIFASLGMKTAAIYRDGGNAEIYATADIIYASGQTLVFDYLRGIPAKYDLAILDEIDFILVEAASHTFAVSTKDSYVRPPEEVYRLASAIADIMLPARKFGWTKKEDVLFDFQYEADVILDMAGGGIEITTRGFSLISSFAEDAAENKLFMEALYACIHAKYFLILDEHYIIRNGEIFLVDTDTGRVGIDCHFDICIQTALEIKEGLKVKEHFLLKNDISYSVFFSLFDNLVGISGTANCVPYDFGNILGKDVKTQNPHFETKRTEKIERFEREEERKERVKELVTSITGPILIACRTDRKAKEYFRYLKEVDKEIEVLDNTCLAYEEEKLAILKRPGTVLISNKIVGRGTDIVTEGEGLTVILAERFLSNRAERQIIGRTGRNGIPGSCYILTCREDRLFYYSSKENFSLSEKHVSHLQKVYEARQYDTRHYLYLRDKIFFEMDISVLEKLKSFSSYEDMRPYVRGDTCREKMLEAIIKRRCSMLPNYEQIIRFEYFTLRPYFQAQYQAYTGGMSQQFMSGDQFYILSDTYIAMGDEFVKDTIKSYISKIL